MKEINGIQCLVIGCIGFSIFVVSIFMLSFTIEEIAQRDTDTEWEMHTLMCQGQEYVMPMPSHLEVSRYEMLEKEFCQHISKL